MTGLDALGARADTPLAPLTSLKVGGAADWLLQPHDVETARAALAAAAEAGLPITFLGGGSNLLVSDDGVAGLVLRPLFAHVEVCPQGDTALLYAAAGVSFSGLARKLARQGWGGLIWAVSVPGTVGGAVVNNAGAFGGGVLDSLVSLDVLDASGRVRELAAAELAYRYRYSRLKHGELGACLVVGARFRLHRDDPARLHEEVLRIQAQRTATQPRQQSAGSVFANPDGDYAARLIDAAGLKGTAGGRAQISTQHANFIVNLGGATARDVYALMTLAQAAVWERHGVWLRPEVQLVGRWSAAERARLEGPPE